MNLFEVASQTTETQFDGGSVYEPLAALIQADIRTQAESGKFVPTILGFAQFSVNQLHSCLTPSALSDVLDVLARRLVRDEPSLSVIGTSDSTIPASFMLNVYGLLCAAGVQSSDDDIETSCELGVLFALAELERIYSLLEAKLSRFEDAPIASYVTLCQQLRECTIDTATSERLMELSECFSILH